GMEILPGAASRVSANSQLVGDECEKRGNAFEAAGLPDERFGKKAKAGGRLKLAEKVVARGLARCSVQNVPDVPLQLFANLVCPFLAGSTSRHSSHDQERFLAADNLVGQSCFRRIEGQIFFAGEES